MASGGVVTLVEGTGVLDLAHARATCSPGFPHGLFFRDTRFLSELRLRVNGEWPEPLAATTTDPFSAAFVLRGAARAPARPTRSLMIFRHRYVGRGMREDITVRNYGLEPAFCALELIVDADFADLFEVKEGRVEKVGDLETDVDGSRLAWAYRRGRFRRGAHLDFSRGAARSRTAHASFEFARAGRAASGRSACSSRPSIDGEEITPRYLCGRPVERSTPGRRASSRGVRSLPTITSDHDGFAALLDRSTEGPRRAAPVRSRASRPHGGRGGCAVVHDAVRARQPAHVVDGDDGRLRPRARHAADAGALPGRRREPDHRGGAGSHPARDALRRVGRAVARRRPHLLRQRRRDAAVRDAARRAAALGQPARGGRRAAPGRRPRPRVDRRVRRPRRRRLRRVPAHERPRARRTRGGRTPTTPPASPTAGSPSRPIALCEVQGYVYAALDRPLALRDRAGRRRLRRRAAARGRGAQAPVQPRLLARGARLARDGPRPRQAAARRAHVEHGPLPLDRHPRRGQGRARRAAAPVRRDVLRVGGSARSRRR